MDINSQLLVVLSSHIGKGNGISAKDLSARMGFVDKTFRNVRMIISALRDEGHAICGTPSDGYYIAATSEELTETCTFLRNRAMHSLRLEAKLRHIPLPDLLGQLHLPT